MKAVKDTMNISMTNCISSVLINCRHAPTGHLIDFLFCPSPENWTTNSSEETSSGRRNQIKDIVWKSKLIINTRTCVGYRKYFEINTELWSFKSLWYCRIVFLEYNRRDSCVHQLCFPKLNKREPLFDTYWFWSNIKAIYIFLDTIH